MCEGQFFGGNTPQCRSGLVSRQIDTMAEHEKCGRAKIRYGICLLEAIAAYEGYWDIKRTQNRYNCRYVEEAE